jgi:di/tricarboxylate transporter
MTVEIAIVFGLILVAMILFAMDGVSFDQVALIVMSTLMLTGILDVKQGLSGFSNPATVTIAAMFALSQGIQKTGVLRQVSQLLSRTGQWALPNAVLVVMVIIAIVSAFINNTAAVVIFIPVLITTANRMDVSPSKLLIPLSFASMFGGVCTLLGTSTNILVSAIAVDNGLEPFSMFEFTPFGLIIVAAGFLYLYLVGLNMVPPRRERSQLEGNFNTADYLSDIHVTAEYAHLGEPMNDAWDRWQLDIEVIFHCRDGRTLSDSDRADLQEGDLVRIRGSAKEIDKLIQRTKGLEVRHPVSWEDVDVSKFNYELIEAVVAPDSYYHSQTIKSIDFAGIYGAMVLGAYHRGRPEMEALPDVRLRGGDSILLAVKEKRIPDLKTDDNFVIVSNVPVTRYATGKVSIALGILAAVVVSAALGWVPIVVSALTGVVLMVLTGCLRPAEIHQAINWKVIFLLAGVIPLGVAMQQTGAARLLSDLIVENLGHLGARAVLSGYFLLTTLLTAMISNQATAAILASLAIETAHGMQVDARPFLMAVTFAASLSLITPWGYQTNTLIYGPGRYRFTDFTKVGAPLNILFWVLGTLCIPIFWPF